MRKSHAFLTLIGVLGGYWLANCQTSAHADERSNLDRILCTNLLAPEYRSSLPHGAFKPRDLWIYPDLIKPSVDRATALLPGFGEVLKDALDKPWNFGNDKIPTCPSPLDPSFAAPYSKIACHARDYIQIDPVGFFSIDREAGITPEETCNDPLAPAKLLHKQVSIIKTELLLEFVIRTPPDKKISIDGIGAVLDKFRPDVSLFDLQGVVQSYNFGFYTHDSHSDCDQDVSNRATTDLFNNREGDLNAVSAQLTSTTNAADLAKAESAYRSAFHDGHGACADSYMDKIDSKALYEMPKYVPKPGYQSCETGATTAHSLLDWQRPYTQTQKQVMEEAQSTCSKILAPSEITACLLGVSSTLSAYRPFFKPEK